LYGTKNVDDDDGDDNKYVTNDQGQLSLAIPPWIAALSRLQVKASQALLSPCNALILST